VSGPSIESKATTALNILQVCLSPSWGGLEMSALKMTGCFLDRGHRSLCLCLKQSELHGQLHEERLPHRSVKLLSHYSPGDVLKLRALIQEYKINLVHSHFLHDLWLLSPALWGLRSIRLFATCHMLFSRTRKKDWAHRLIYRRVDRLIALTRIACDVHLRCLPVLPDQMVIIPNGVDLSIFSPAKYDRNSVREEFGIGADEPLVGSIGRLDQGKGQEELIRAAGDVVAEFPDYKFLIVGEKTKGEGSEFSNKIRNLISRLGLERNVILTGFRPDAPRILRALDVFAFPSYKETFGMSLLEAMAMQVPVIATDSGGVPEILDYGKCGILVPPQAAGPVAAAIKKLLRAPELAQKMVSLARTRVEEQYDLQLTLDRIEDLYYGLSGRKLPVETSRR
jgi:glycosyltransferase involved in cell wall biosynthesis